MNKLCVTAVSRSPVFSPNCEKNDELIMAEVCSKLKSYGVEVKDIPETAVDEIEKSKADLYLNMARGKEALTVLCAKETLGVRIVNSAKSVMKYNRMEIVRTMMGHGVPMPQSEITKTGTKPAIPFPYWLKRGSECAQSPWDVCFVDSESKLMEAWKYFRDNKIEDVVASKHQKGDLVKFYGVAGTDFFYTCLPTRNGGCGKFGAEKINGEPHFYSYEHEKLKTECNGLAGLLKVPVYGGDCIVDIDGNFRIVDFNDWPSFSRCRDKAAEAITHMVCKTLKQEQNAENDRKIQGTCECNI